MYSEMKNFLMQQKALYDLDVSMLSCKTNINFDEYSIIIDALSDWDKIISSSWEKQLGSLKKHSNQILSLEIPAGIDFNSGEPILSTFITPRWIASFGSPKVGARSCRKSEHFLLDVGVHFNEAFSAAPFDGSFFRPIK